MKIDYAWELYGDHLHSFLLNSSRRKDLPGLLMIVFEHEHYAFR